ncbi:demethoxyubiquinone hydroxylase family protein [Cellvibrio sp. NN19]|uniref:demethoxyubiquinone hydroxylase family protein n=1 Tax=Cellvibrio chitinivorans TaxID=3102792 RepID=UPI002B40401B|nr:demethoxyubiquinone hydroxylase family protein [Cellvibrio sp. NN19]
MKEVERILRVDHAGEFGAINIYRAQLFVARIFYKDIASQLEEMLSHEKVHFNTFNKILVSRSIRHCYAIHLWAFGGFILGLFTALIGRNAIWVCTNSIESTVLHHLEWQLDFLSKNDLEVHNAVLSIKTDEEAHQEFGQTNDKNSLVYKPIFYLVRQATEFAIWLSTKL